MIWAVEVTWATRDGDQFTTRSHVEARDEDDACMVLENRAIPDRADVTFVMSSAVAYNPA